eukprot:gnl/MRDRNA2_/MRDRNA2_172084_c0_seq1.p1 gnl/MRDRNA2_/MRDRNA2_172084_c0~~gnl/MRDRNA2_/MRDRNA2_172084_c0_seq1.p1  ORF type:complete len:333 (+),score=37.73 gnl/MRDRNA2_/MRDRNA2_172084_c0_seq1:115-999(+)
MAPLYTSIYSLRAVGTKYPVIVLVTDKTWFKDKDLKSLNAEVRLVDMMYGHCKIDKSKTRLQASWTKLHLFNLVDFKLVVTMDTDLVVMQNIDHIFHSIKPDVDMGSEPVGGNKCKGRPQSMNIGVWAIRPSKALFKYALNMTKFGDFKCDPKHGVQTMIAHLMTRLYWDRGRKVHCYEIPYNCKADTMSECQFRADEFGKTGKIYVLHWSGEAKPWHDWWDRALSRPKQSLTRTQVKSVKLWWQLKEKTKQFLRDADKIPRITIDLKEESDPIRHTGFVVRGDKKAEPWIPVM